MNNSDLYKMLELPAEVIEKLNSYEKERTFQMPAELQKRLLTRMSWDDAVKELQELLEGDSHGFQMLYEMLHIVCEYSYPKYKELKVSDEIFAETMKFVTRFLKWHMEYYGEYKFTQALWFPREMAVVEFRIGALEYEFIDEETREIAIHIPSDAVFNRESVLESLKAFVSFRNEYFPEWQGVNFVCDTWMLAPAMEELLSETSNVLAFKHMFELDVISEDATWFMGFIFPGHENDDLEKLPETSSLHKKVKAYLLSGKKIGVAKGHLTDEIMKIIGG